MTGDSTEAFAPAPLAGERGAAQTSRKPDSNLLGLPPKAYQELMFQGRSISGRWLLVSDPAVIRRVLVENAANYPKTAFDTRFFAAIFGGGLLGLDGEDWRRHRRIMAPAFDPRSVAAYGPAMADSISAFLARWDGLPDGALVDMAEEMTALSLEVISRTAFSTDSAEMSAHVRHTVDAGIAAASLANILDLAPVLKDIRMRQRARAVGRASGGFDRAIEALLHVRSGSPEGPADLVTRLMHARDAEGGASLTAKEIRDEIVTIYIAGHETTASTLGWTLYLLSQRPAVGERLREELDDVLGHRDPRPEDLPRLVYARRVVEESLRLYPAVPGLSNRRALEADELGGRRVAKGTGVFILPWVLHRHEKLWDQPERFDPDRFSPERSAGRPRFSYLPFGAGPRVCIGQLVALNEAVLSLAAIARRYEPQLAPDADIALQANVTLRAKFGLPMQLVRREPAAQRQRLKSTVGPPPRPKKKPTS